MSGLSRLVDGLVMEMAVEVVVIVVVVISCFRLSELGAAIGVMASRMLAVDDGC